jgi:hypothetical protein
VRGDSLRDLYAKTLALFGLALLAGVGALVDYWPASGALPVVASPMPGPVPVRLPDLASIDVDTLKRAAAAPTAPRAARPRPALVRRVPVNRPVDVALHALPLVPVVDDIPVTDAVTLGEPPLPAAVTPVVATRLPAPEIELPPAPVPGFGPSQPGSAGGDGSADGFFGNATSAFKKTGESIVNTTVKTGSSILKAFGLVGGAFKKVI